MTKSRPELPEDLYFDQFHNALYHSFADHSFPADAYAKPMSWEKSGERSRSFASGGSVIDQLRRGKNADVVSRALMLTSKKV